MYRVLCVILIVGMSLYSPARGQNSAANQQPVSREEFDQLKKDNAEMKKALADLKKQQTESTVNTEQDAQDFEKSLKGLKESIDKARPGLESIVIAGDAAVGFQTQRKTDSSFFADVSPLILWQPADSRFLVEFAFDLAIGGADVNSQNTTATLNLADISYDVCDFLTVGGGLFAVPFGQFHNHFDPPWINKFPDNPLAFDAIAPVSEVGFFAKGAIPAGTTKWTYDVYAANGANLITNDPAAAGQLNFNDYTDINNNKAVGGRIGFLPFPDIEMGYSIQYSNPNPHGFDTVHAILQAGDFHWKPIIQAAGGQFDLAGEWIWSSLGNNTYDPTGALGFGPTTFNNYRQGGYASLGYRPTLVDNKILRNTEFLIRYDTLQSNLSSPGGEHESRWTLGIDYWVTPYCVVKGAYEIDKKKLGDNQNAFILQVGFGL